MENSDLNTISLVSSSFSQSENSVARSIRNSSEETAPSTSSVSVLNTYNYFDYKRSRSNSPNDEPNLLDLSYLDLKELDTALFIYLNNKSPDDISTVLLNNNLISELPPLISLFQNVYTLDLSSNQLRFLSQDICKLTNLRTLIVKDNLLEDSSLPKDLGNLIKLESINLSGNLFTQFPYQLLDIHSLKEIYLGSNKICSLPRSYENLQALEVLYLGGNQIKAIPEELAELRNLTSLNLSNNQLQSLPNSLMRLKFLKNLALHFNNLTTLPIELVKLNLRELSLRNNPLINRFAKEYSYSVPSLLELSGRVVKSKNIDYSNAHLPKNLKNYLNSAQHCLNPRCKGVYFTSKVEHIKFVDFCGKYRIPFMQYLCSSTCNEKVVKKKINSAISSSDSASDSDDMVEDKLLKKILMG